jgi:hypothetical protein
MCFRFERARLFSRAERAEVKTRLWRFGAIRTIRIVLLKSLRQKQKVLDTGLM